MLFLMLLKVSFVYPITKSKVIIKNNGFLMYLAYLVTTPYIAIPFVFLGICNGVLFSLVSFAIFYALWTVAILIAMPNHIKKNVA